MTSTNPGVSSSKAWTAVGVLLVMAVLSYLDRQIIGLLVEPMRRDLNIGDVQISLLQGISFALFYCICGLPMGVLADRWSRRWLVWAGITIWSLAAIASGLARNYEQLLVARFFVGAGEAALSPAAYSMISDMFLRRRLAFALSTFAIGASVGAAAAFAVGGLVIAALTDSHIVIPGIGEMHPWQMVFVLTGAPGLVIGLLIFLLPEPVRQGAANNAKQWSLRPLFDFLKDRSRFVLGHFFGFGVIALLAYGASAWAPAILIRRFGMAARDAGVYLGLMMLIGGLVGFLSNGWIVDRWFAAGRADAHLRFYAISIPCCAALTIAACFMPNALLFLLLIGVAQTLLCFSGVAAASIQVVTPNELRGQVSVLYIFVMNLIGFGFGPSSVALFTEYVYHNPASVNLSLASVELIFAPIASALMCLAMRPMREAAKSS